MPKDRRFRPIPFDGRFQPGERVVPEVVLPMGRTIIIAEEARLILIQLEDRLISAQTEDRNILLSVT